MSNRIAVIGSNSFSGAHFVSLALEQDYSVIGISRSPQPNAVFLPYAGKPGDFSFHQLDLNLHLNEIMALLDAQKPDYVVNFAAQSMVGQSWLYPEHWFTTNVVSTVKFHDQLRQRDWLKRYVHISTPEVYGSTSGLVSEQTPYNPSTPYAVSRAAADMSLHTFFATYNFPVVFTRAANVFGPGQQLYRIVPRTALYNSVGKILQLHGGGHSVRSFIHARDVADGTLRVMRQGTDGAVYHLSTERQISIRDLVAMICTSMGKTFEQCVEVVADRPGKDSAYLLDSVSARKNLGWQPQIDLEKGIEQTIRWVSDNLDTLRDQPFDYIHKA